MKKIQVVLTMQFNRKHDFEFYKEYSPLALLLASNQGVNSNAVKETINDIESGMDEGKKYRITIEEI